MKSYHSIIRLPLVVSLLLISACGKNMSLQVDTSKLSGQNTTTGTTDAVIDATQVKKNNSLDSVDPSPTPSSSPTLISDVPSSGTDSTQNVTQQEPSTNSASEDHYDMTQVGVLQPFSVADEKRLTQDLQILLSKDTREQHKRKLARALFKIRPYESLKRKTRRGIPFTGQVNVILVIDKTDNNIDFSNFSVCLFKDIEKDSCRSDQQISAAKAYIGNPMENSEIKIDLMKAFGAKKASHSIEILFRKSQEYSLYHRKILLSFEGVKKVFGSKLLVESKDRKGATSTPDDYDLVNSCNVEGDEIIPSAIR